MLNCLIESERILMNKKELMWFTEKPSLQWRKWRISGQSLIASGRVPNTNRILCKP